MSNAYAEVIDLLNSGNVDYRRIAIELAKTSPSLFLRLHNGKAVKKLLTTQAYTDIRNAICGEALVNAIKALRVATQSVRSPHGLGLKEARDIIMVAAGRENLYLAPELQAYVNEIKA